MGSAVEVGRGSRKRKRGGSGVRGNMPTNRVNIAYTPHPKQALFHGLVDSHLLTLLIGGVGSGKTKAGVAEAIRRALMLPGSLGMVCAPTYPMLRDSTQAQFLEMIPWGVVSDWNKSENRVELVNGAVVLFRSTEWPERLRGPNLWWWYLDEAGIMARMVFLIMLARLRDGGRQRRGFITTTPKGFTWLHEEFVVKAGEDRGMVKVSSWDNPHLPDGFVALLESTYGGQFRDQEVGGEFVALEGLIYGELGDEERYVVERDRKEFVKFYGGIDWGFTHPMCAGVGGVRKDGGVYVMEALHQSRLPIDDVVRWVKEMTSVYGVERWFCGHDEPGNIERLCREGVNAVKADTSVSGGIADVSGMLGGGEVPRLQFSPGVMKVYDDCRMYHWEMDREGVSTGRPAKVKDDGADMVRYLVRGAKDHGGIMPRIVVI